MFIFLFLLIFIPTAVALFLFFRWLYVHEYRIGYKAGRRDVKERFGVDLDEPPSDKKEFWRDQWRRY